MTYVKRRSALVKFPRDTCAYAAASIQNAKSSYGHTNAFCYSWTQECRKPVEPTLKNSNTKTTFVRREQIKKTKVKIPPVSKGQVSSAQRGLYAGLTED